MYSQQSALDFYNLFDGAKDFYGVTQVGEIVDGKAKSESKCIKSRATPVLIQQHLEGKISIGMSPLREDNTVAFGAIDIDDYQGQLEDVVMAIYDFDFPICPCYSKSKKLHLYFFFADETYAHEAVDIMRWYANAFNCPDKVEIFPKQLKRSASNRAYSWINLPYYDCNNAENHRKMVKSNGELADISEFCARAKASKMGIEQHKALIEALSFYDAPPCILRGAVLRSVPNGGRNKFMYNAATFFKLKSESEDDEGFDWEQETIRLNESLAEPLEMRELEQTVLKSKRRTTGYYQCERSDWCSSKNCRKVPTGKGHTLAQEVKYGKIIQQKSDPPTYLWEISGKQFFFESEKELLGQQIYREQVLQHLYRAVETLREDIWVGVLNNSLKDIEVLESENKGGDFSKGARLFSLIMQYFSDKRKAQNATQLKMGRVLYDEKTDEYVFGAWSLLSFIMDTNGYKGFSQMQIRKRLVDLGAYQQGQWWRIPKSSLENETSEVVNQDVQIDLTSKEQEDGVSADF